MNTITTLFAQAQSNTKAAAAFKTLMDINAITSFDLVGYGVPAIQQKVTVKLLQAAYGEVVSLLNAAPNKDHVAGFDRGQSLSEFDDEYLGEKRPLTTEQKLEAAVLAAAMVYRFGMHLAAITDSGADKARDGSSGRPEWVAVDFTDEAIVAICKAKGKELLTLIAAGDTRIQIIRKHYKPTLVNFRTYLLNQVAKQKDASEWGIKLASALAQVDNSDPETMGIDTVKASITQWANEPSYQRKLTRLEEATKNIGDTAFKFSVQEKVDAQELPELWANNIFFLAMSPQFLAAREEFRGSKELYKALTGCLEIQVTSFAEKRDEYEASAAAERFKKLGELASEKLMGLIKSSETHEDYELMLAAKQQIADTRAKQRAAIRLQTEVAIMERVTLNVLDDRAAEKMLSGHQKRMKQLAEMLKPAPKAKAAPKVPEPKLAKAAKPKPKLAVAK